MQIQGSHTNRSEPARGGWHHVYIKVTLPDTEAWWSFSLTTVYLSFSFLLSLGADPELENDCGEKPADLIDEDNKELLELFGLAANDWDSLKQPLNPENRLLCRNG